MKGLFILYIVPVLIAVLIALLVWMIYRKQFQNLVRPLKYKFSFSGAPPYIAGSTSGSPLSDLGSYCGFKAVPEKSAACSSALFATLTSFGSGRICDFGIRLYLEDGSMAFDHPDERKVHFKPYQISEVSVAGSLTLSSRLYFLQHNLAVLETEWEAGKDSIRIKPALYFMPTIGRDLENPYPHFNGFTSYSKVDRGLCIHNRHRWPGQKIHACFLATDSNGVGKKELQGAWVDLKPGEKHYWPVVISFSADSSQKAVARAERALRCLRGLRSGAEKRWLKFESKLVKPAETKTEKSHPVLKLAAWALHNSLYSPRDKMRGWGSVPAKVYFPFIWGWDTPQHVLGLSEWNPGKAGDVLLTQFDSNLNAPQNARFKIRVKGITICSGVERDQIPSKADDSLRGVLDFYSQPPLQSWAAVRVYNRLKSREEREHFLKRVLIPLQGNVRWWEENRLLNNGLFSYINGLESGLDDSPRFYPPSFLPSFIIGLVPRFFSAVDLNSWLYQSYVNTAYLAGEADFQNDKTDYLLKANKLKEDIDQQLWSNEYEAWLDRRNDKYIEVITPSIWWPAFVGAASDLQKVRAVVERYLLQPGKFWGEYGIPSVAFDDDSYNSRKDGYYWRGQIWMINNYAALEVLFRFGYARQAAELHRRVMQAIYISQGLYETYNATTGAIGWSSRGPGDPAVMQFGMSSAWATQIIYCRYQHFRYIFPETDRIEGYIQWAALYGDKQAFSPPGIEESPRGAVLKVQAPVGSSYKIPRITMQSEDAKPLLDAKVIRMRFDDPAGYYGEKKSICFTWKGKGYSALPGLDYYLRPRAELDEFKPKHEVRASGSL